MRVLEVVVPPEAGGGRLDRVLAELSSGVSRAEVTRWIEAGRVEVDGVPKKKPSERVRGGARLRALPLPPPASDALPDASVVVDVVYRDDDIIVVDKPAGMVVHPAKGHATGTLVNGLLALFSREGIAPAETHDDGDGNQDGDGEVESELAMQRPGIVHRIDRGTSGLLVVARTVAAREALKKTFAAHDLERVYDAIALGALPDTITYDTRYGRHPTDRKAFTSKPRGEGKRAVTHVTVVERLALPSLAITRVECRLETGRTHQIRVHLAEHGASLLGDRTYGKNPRDAAVRAIGEELGRQALHARLLAFAHPITRKSMRFESPWPADFLRAISELRALAAAHVPRRHRP